MVSSPASVIAATLERQLEELDRLINVRDKIRDSVTTAGITAEVRTGRITFTHLKVEDLVRSGINGVMQSLVEDQRAICQCTAARLEEAMALMGIVVPADPPPPDTGGITERGA